MKEVSNFVVLDSVYGRFLLNRYCHYQSDAILKTGYTHIEDELNNIFIIIDRLPDNCIIVDGGANAGFFTIPVAQRVKEKNGLVISFEPQREIFNGLAGTVALNNLSNVRINRMGLGNIDGSASLPKVDYSVSQDFGLISVTQDKVFFNLHDEVVDQSFVKIVTIDEINLPRLDFLKLDVEGYEISAIEGAIKTILQYRPFIWVEYWKVGLVELKHSLDFIENYQCVVMDNLNALFAPAEKIKSLGIKVVSNI